MAGEVASMGSDDALMQDDYSQQGHKGKVESISQNDDGSANVRVVHGKKKKSASGELHGFHRNSSSVTVPKEHAGKYKIGQHVHVGLSPAAAPTPPVKGKKPAAKKAPPKKVAAKKKAPSPIAQAMTSGAPLGGAY